MYIHIYDVLSYLGLHTCIHINIRIMCVHLSMCVRMSECECALV